MIFTTSNFAPGAGLPQNQYLDFLVAVCNGFVYISSGDLMLLANGQSGGALLGPHTAVSMAYINGVVYIVDGTNLVELVLATATVQQVQFTESVSALTSSGSSSPFLATATVTNTGNLTSGQTVTIAGDTSASPSPYNGEFPIVVISSTQFTYEIISATTPVTPATGTITVTNVKGTLPTNCSLAANWRGRLWLAGDSNNPQNFYQSRVGDPTDFDYSQTDPAAAVAGNLSVSGQIGEPISAIIPYTDDYALTGCAHSLWMFEGDLADGGTIVRVSDNMGLLGKDAWTVDPEGQLYFVANGGLFSVRPIWEFYQPPQLLSDQSYDQFFQELSYGFDNVQLEWDADQHRMLIFVTPSDGSQGTHLQYDKRNGGLWPLQYPPVAGPFSSCLFLGDGGANQRVILLGGLDGWIRQLDLSLTDDSSTIASSIVLGPVRLDQNAAILNAVTVNLGEVPANLAGNVPIVVTGEMLASTADFLVFTSAHIPIVNTQAVFVNGMWQDSTYTLSGSTYGFNPGLPVGAVITANYTYQSSTNPDPWNVDAQLASGPDAYSVTEGLPHNSAVISFTLERRQKTTRQRLRGGWFSMTLENTQPSTFFSFESAILEFIDAGRNRERR